MSDEAFTLKMAEFDSEYFSKLSKYLDSHMKVMIYESLMQKDCHNKESGLKKLIEETENTRMINYLIKLLQELNPDETVSSQVKERLVNEEKNIDEMHNKYSQINTIVSSENFKNYIKIYSSNDDDILRMAGTHFNLPKNYAQFFLEYARMLYDIGQYEQCSNVLGEYHQLISTKPDILLDIFWGKLACDILTNNLESAVDIIEHITHIIDTSTMSKHKKINHQAYLLHWSSFVYLRSSSLTDRYFDLCVRNSSYKHALEMVAPHLLRYVVVSFIATYKDDSDFQILLDFIHQEEYHYSDCFTQFINSIFSVNDIECAISNLKSCLLKFNNDFFIRDILEDFERNAYFIILKRYAQLHMSFTLEYISQYLGISLEFTTDLVKQLLGSDDIDPSVPISLDNDINIDQKFANRIQQLCDDISKRELIEIE